MNIWEKLSQSLQKEEAIMGYRNTPENLRTIHLAKMAAMEIKEGKIISFAALWPTDDPFWLEVGSVWVDDIFRGKKYSSKVFHNLVNHKIPPDKRVFSITHSVSQIIHLLIKEGFVEVPGEKWDGKVPYKITCQPCDKKQTSCPLKGNECRLFYLP